MADRPSALADQALLFLVKWGCYLANPLVVAHTAYKCGHLPDPARPRRIGDKFLWRKLFDRNPLFVTACDKLACKAYVKERCPELKFARVLWSGQDAARIPDALLRRPVVLKANHGSGWFLLLQGNEPPEASRRQAARWAGRRFGWRLGEWAYKEVRRGLLIEEMLLEDGQPVASEYKFHVAGGRTAYVFCDPGRGRDGGQRMTLDRDGRAYLRTPDGGTRPAGIAPPACFVEMRRIAERLAAPFDFLRCDLYAIDGEIYFSELTVYPYSGHGRPGRDPIRAERNRLWDLRRAWFLTAPQRGWRRHYAAALRRWLDRQEAPQAAPGPGLAHDSET